ncbi:MAG: hypothetical protein IPL79_17825 [Myxococcales bacterium]|nr:hypothetical protein [Myxococcales bacterium]
MKRILLAFGCVVGLTSCLYSDSIDEGGQGEVAEVPIYGPGSQEELCPLLEPDACRTEAGCRQEGTCLGGTCAQIELTACLPVSFGTPGDVRSCSQLDASDCRTRADCLSAVEIGGGSLCIPESRTEDTHISDDDRVIVTVDLPQVVR